MKTYLLERMWQEVLTDKFEIFLIGIVVCGVQLGPLGTAATNRPIVPVPGDYDDGEVGGITRRKPTPVPLCPPQTPHAARTRTRAAAVGSQLLSACATARPNSRYCPSICVEVLRNTTKTVSQGSRSSGRHLYKRRPEYEAGVFFAQPRFSVKLRN
jgi:hypothetical protein